MASKLWCSKKIVYTLTCACFAIFVLLSSQEIIDSEMSKILAKLQIQGTNKEEYIETALGFEVTTDKNHLEENDHKDELVKREIPADVAKSDNANIKYIYYIGKDDFRRVNKRQLMYSNGFFKGKCHLEEKTCLVTLDRNYLGPGNVDKFDAIVFRVRHLKFDKDAKRALPPKRSQKQRYVFYNLEAPRLKLVPRFVNKKYMDTNFYNWTMHFRHDADIVAPYGPDFRRKKDPPPYLRATRKRLPNKIGLNINLKTKAVFWIASHCPTEIAREKYVKALQQYIQVDAYGDCGNLTCVEAHNGRNPCVDDNAIEYYFYLAFENSICPDYISEKFWRNLNHPVVNVVMGGGNYSRDAPPHSFIDVNDFPSVEALADYLKFLMDNPDEYKKYFDWKQEYVMYKKDPFCILCEKLHDEDEPVKMYPSMTDWFYFDDKGNWQCTNGSERKYYNSVMELTQ